MSVIDSVKPKLQMTASVWVRQMFPKGVVTGGVLRVGDLTGTKGNSTAIALHGDDAGSFIDFATNESGDCLDLISIAEGISIQEALARGLEIVGGDIKEIQAAYEEAKKAQRERDEKKAEYIRLLVKQSRPLKGSVAERYLSNRGVTSFCKRSLRFLPKHKHQPSGEYFPVMLALVQDATGQGVAVHRTYLKPDGSGKADVEPNKMMLGNVCGGAVRLGGVDPDGIIGVAEGIETALSASALNDGLPVWAVLSSSGMINFELPTDEALEALAIFRDNDKSGENASAKLSKTTTILNEVYAPNEKYNDFNDELRAVYDNAQRQNQITGSAEN